MKILIVSDSHFYNDDLERIVNKYRNKVDFMIHCGDSSLPSNDFLIKQFDIVVGGNHDDAPFPTYQIYKDICVIHGHTYHIYKGYDEILKLCMDHQCYVCFHGHTHVPTYQIINNIHFINPGSLMMNRGTYGYGTYALVNYETDVKEVNFYHHKTDELCSNVILEEGLLWLEEFKKNAKKQGY